MSSLVDVVLRSDFDIPTSSPGALPEIPRTPRAGGGRGSRLNPASSPRRSEASRPRGTLHSEDGEDELMGDPEDEVVGLRGAAGRPRRLGDVSAIPKVQDQTSEILREIFEQFLEE